MNKDREILIDYAEYEQLQQENKQLHKRINKAIKYINKNKAYIDIEDMGMYLYESDINKVIEILKDSDVDE